MQFKRCKMTIVYKWSRIILNKNNFRKQNKFRLGLNKQIRTQINSKENLISKKSNSNKKFKGKRYPYYCEFKNKKTIFKD